MRRTTLALLLGAAMLTLAIAGCGGGDDDDDDGGGAAEPTPTETAAAGGGGGAAGEVATLIQDKDPGDFYRLNCSACHGQEREGISGLGLPLLPERLSESDDFYFDTVKNGRAGTVMPAWGATGLTDPEIRALLALIRQAP